MSHLPITCPGCNKPGPLYSTGVIPCPLGSGHDYPVVKCGRCRCVCFLPPPYDTWKGCHVHALIAFTKDPDAIDYTLKLAYHFHQVAGRGWYWVYPASQG